MKAREGDLIESVDGIVFDVKGVVHPPDRAIAFIRYVPDPEGSRERDGTRYSKFYNLSKRYALLKQKYPQYLVDDPVFNTLLCEVPHEDIETHYQPARGLHELRNRINIDEAETAALRFMEILKENVGIARKFKPLTEAEIADLLKSTEGPAQEGKFEEYKTYTPEPDDNW